jgi:hypothetical protein
MNRSIKSLIAVALVSIGVISIGSVAARAPSSPAECARLIQMCANGAVSACLMVEDFCPPCRASDAQAKPLVAKGKD